MSDIASRIASLPPKKLALYALKLQQRLDAIDASAREPIAIVGMSCRFPAAEDADAFWRLLASGVDAIREIPAERWPIDAWYDPDPGAPGKMSTRWGGFLAGVDRFDSGFFGISPREAAEMDPQQRLLLESTWDALEDGGLTADLYESRTGVFVGLSTHDYDRLRSGAATAIDAYGGTGASPSVAAGRIAYLLGLHGPCVTLDTACSTSLVALHFACASLRAGECDLALVGAVNLILDPETSVFFSKLRTMASDGRCKAFDAAADGYVRAEGSAVLALKRLSAARRDGDRVRALIRATAINHDGPSSGLTVPNGSAQRDVIRRALESAGLSPDAVDYVETHGTGTSLGDPIEVAALADVFAPGRSASRPLRIGSVKTNIGHAEAAAGIAGVCKVVLALEHRQLPPQLHLRSPNPRIRWADIPVEVVTRLCEWEARDGRRIAGVSSFGFSGTNAHAVLEEAAARVASAVAPPRASGAPLLLGLSAKTPTALGERARAMASLLARADGPPLEDVVFTANRRRSHQHHRLAVVGRSAADLARELERAVTEGWPQGAASEGRPATVFVFSGHGSQWAGMCRELLDEDPLFREVVDACDAVFVPESSVRVAAELAAADETRLDRLEIAQPVIFAVQMALAALWRRAGVEPDAVVGHSLGEVAAACIAGALDLADGARVVARRSQALRRLTGGTGSLAAIDLPRAAVEERIARDGSVLEIAAVNGPTTTVVAGDRPRVLRFVAELEGDGVFCRVIRADAAGHSRAVDRILPELEESLRAIAGRPAPIRFESAVTGAAVRGEELGAAYWLRNVRQPVLFETACRDLAASGHQLFVEISPHPLLRLAIEQTLRSAEAPGRVVGSLRRGEPADECLLRAVAEIWEAGGSVDLGALPPERGAVVGLPAYPWQRERHWSAAATRDRRTAAAVASGAIHGRRLDSPLAVELYERTVSAADPEADGHRVFGTAVMPAAGFVAMLLSAQRERRGAVACQIFDIAFERPLALADDEPPRAVQLVVGDGAEVWSRAAEGWVRHVRALLEEAPPDRTTRPIEDLRALCPQALDPTARYASLHRLGYHLGPAFQRLDGLWNGTARAEAIAGDASGAGDLAGQALGSLRIAAGAGGVASALLDPGSLDGCFQVLGAACSAQPALGPGDLYVPAVIGRLSVLGGATRSSTHLWCHARVTREDGDAGAIEGDLALYADDGTAVAVIEGLRAQRIDHQKLVSEAGLSTRWLHSVEWRSLPSAQPQPRGQAHGAWLVAGDPERGARAADALVRLGVDVVRAADPLPAATDELDRLLRSTLRSEGALQGVVYVARSAGEPSVCVPTLPSRGAPGAGESRGAASHGAESYAVAAEEALSLIQSLTRLEIEARLLLVTRTAVAPEHGMLWGLGRAVRNELSGIDLRLVDVDRAIAVAEPRDAARDPETLLAERLAAEALAEDGESQVRLAGVGRLGARLAPARIDARALRLSADASYLVTGGLGGVGLAVAERLMELGARRLVLVGRSASAANAPAPVERLRQRGCRVEVVAADVADRASVARVLDRIAAEGPPLRGIVHAAGVFDDASLAALTPHRLRLVAAPKVLGALHLDELTRGLELDFVVYLSSVAGLLGAPAQASYAAANAGLDAIAEHRRRHGLPATSLLLAAVSDAGELTRDGARLETLQRRGLAALTAAQALRALELAVAAAVTPVAVIPFAISAWKRAVPAAAGSALLAEVDAGSPAATRDLLAELAAAPASTRRRLLAEALIERIAAVLRMAPSAVGADVPFGELGFDSLMTIELRGELERELGVRVPASTLFNHPSANRLTRHLLRELALDGSAGAAAGPDGRAVRVAGLAGMSEDEAEALLAEKLSALQARKA